MIEETTMGHVNIARLLDDRPAERIFRVHRDVYRDRELFRLELERVFEGTWNYVGLESQIAQPNDFVTTYIGRQPVILLRDNAGVLRCFLNTCRHRGAMICPFRNGNAKFHACRYHGWAWESSGKNVVITAKDTGNYPPAFEAENHDLLSVAKLASYRGLIFASLSPDVPSLEEHLGEARWWLDVVLDQSNTGWEYVPGSVSYTFDANWKLQFENGLDHYHFNATHSGYVDVLNRRAEVQPLPWKPTVETDPEAQGSYSFPRGHAVMWSIRNPARGVRPLAMDKERLEAVRKRVGETRLAWMLRQRNLTIFPNMQLIDITSSQLRTWRPLAVDKTEMTSHCIAPIGENPEARRFRIRQYEDFFNTTGLATSDDNVMYEFCQSGYAAEGGYTQGYFRGLAGEQHHVSRELAEQAGFTPADWRYGPLAFGDETCFHAGYREWRRLLAEER
jgi:benzoate/toluate 1,2-dioxygenase subunit alpha